MIKVKKLLERQPKIVKICLLIVFILIGTSCRTIKSRDPHLPPEDQATAKLTSRDNWNSNSRNAQASFYYMVGEDKLLRGQYAEARNLFQSSYEVTPNSFLAAKLLEVEILRGSAPKSLTDAKRFALLYPTSARIRSLYGNMLLQAGQLQDGVVELEKAIKLGAQEDSTYMQMIRVKLTQKNQKAAFEIIKNWVKNIPHSADAHFEMSKVFLATRNNKDAMSHAMLAMQLNPNRPEIILLAALTLEMNGNSKRAVELYEKLYRSNSDNEQLLVHMAGLYKQLGEPKDALELLDELLRKAKGQSKIDISVQRAIVLWEMGRFEEASKIFIALHEQNKNSKRLQYLAGLGYEKNGQPQKAFVIYEDLEKTKEFFKPARVRRAVILNNAKKTQEAIELIEDLQALNQNSDPELFIFLAEFQSDAGRHKESIASMQSAIKIQPESAAYHFFLGVYQEKAGDKAACIETMRKVIKLDQRYSAAYNYIGYIYAESGEKLLEAKALVERALSIKPNDGLYLDSLGWIYFKLKDYEKAQIYLTQAQKLQPDEGIILAHLADVYLALGQKAKAADLFRKALTLHLEKSDKEKVLQKYRSIGGQV